MGEIKSIDERVTAAEERVQVIDRVLFALRPNDGGPGAGVTCRLEELESSDAGANKRLCAVEEALRTNIAVVVEHSKDIAAAGKQEGEFDDQAGINEVVEKRLDQLSGRFDAQTTNMECIHRDRAAFSEAIANHELCLQRIEREESAFSGDLNKLRVDINGVRFAQGNTEKRVSAINQRLDTELARLTERLDERFAALDRRRGFRAAASRAVWRMSERAAVVTSWLAGVSVRVGP